MLLSPKRQKVDGKRKTDKPVAPLPPAKKKCPPRKVVSKPSPQPHNEKSGDKEVLIDSDLILLSPDVLLSPKRQKVDGKRRTDKPVAPLPPANKKCPPRKVVWKPSPSPQPHNEKSGDKEVLIDSDLILLSPDVLLSPKRQKVDGKRRTDKPVAPLPPAKKKCPPRKVVSKPTTQPHKEKSGYKEVVIDSDLILLSPEEPVVHEWYQSGIFNPLGEETQRRLCRQLGLRFIKSNGCTGGGTDVPLRAPRSMHRIQGDGNCLFRAFSYAITGSERQHLFLRRA